MPSQGFQLPRGTRDTLPKDQPYWKKFVEVSERTLYGLGAEKIDVPHFENIEVFSRGIGEGTDIVSKEMFLLEQSKEKDDSLRFALRPEGTAGVVRAFIQNGMGSWRQPVRLFYLGAMFRHERPQKGRYREFNQLGLEIFGDESAKSDYLAIMSAWEIFSRLGLKDLKVYANSIGCPICRPKYLIKLKKFLKDKIKDLCFDCKNRYDANPLRAFDCKEEKCQKSLKAAPTTLDNLCRECRDHFQSTLEYLDYFDIKYALDSTLVRGLDYYTNTVFEIADKADKTRQNVVAAGGRYNGLVKLLGGPSTPAVGYSIGVERTISLMQEQGIQVDKHRGVEVCILQLGEKAKEISKTIYDSLSSNDVNVFFVPSNEGLGQQIKMASKLGAKYAVIIGQREAFKDEIILRDLETSSQEVLPTKALVEEVQNRFEKCRCKASGQTDKRASR